MKYLHLNVLSKKLSLFIKRTLNFLKMFVPKKEQQFK